jgi:hypothetical protein
MRVVDVKIVRFAKSHCVKEFRSMSVIQQPPMTALKVDEGDLSVFPCILLIFCILAAVWCCHRITNIPFPNAD